MTDRALLTLPSGSSTGIGMGILRSLAAAGATTVMHGLVSEVELQEKTVAVAKEFGQQVAYSSANLLKPQEIRCVGTTVSVRWLCSIGAILWPVTG